MKSLTVFLIEYKHLLGPVSFLTRALQLQKHTEILIVPTRLPRRNIGASVVMQGRQASCLLTMQPCMPQAQGHLLPCLGPRAFKQLTRGFSSSAEEERQLMKVAEGNRLKFARYLIICMLIALGVKVLPALGRNSVEHAMMLMESQEPFWQRSGIDRARVLAKAETTAEKLLQAGAAQRLVNILECQPEPENIHAALMAVSEFSQSYKAREAFVRAGVAEVLQRLALEEGTNKELAHQLLIMYIIQQNHVE